MSLLRGTYDVSLNVYGTPGLPSQDLATVTVEGDTAIDLNADLGAPVEGHVVDSTGDLAAGVAVTATRVGRYFSSTGTTDALGAFRLSLVRGTYSFSVARYDTSAGSAAATWYLGRVDVHPGIPVELALPSGATLRGRVAGPNGQAAPAQLRLVRDPRRLSSGDNLAATVVTDAQGRYEVALAPGSYPVAAATADEYRPLIRVLPELSLAGDRVQDVVLPAPASVHTVSGHIAWEQTGGPVVAAQMLFYDEVQGLAREAYASGGPYQTELPPGRYWAHLTLYRSGSASLDTDCGPLAVTGDRTWDISVGEDGTPVTEEEPRPHVFRLGHPYPNPFNGQAVIPYELPDAGQASLVVYDILGQRVRELVREVQAVGEYRLVWDGRDGSGQTVGTGVYLGRLQAGSHVQVTRMLLLR